MISIKTLKKNVENVSDHTQTPISEAYMQRPGEEAGIGH